MNLHFDISLADGYHSTSQQVRIMSEDWILRNTYCPRCGSNSLSKYPNNNPACDFFCRDCRANYELKSSGHNFGEKIVDGAYKTMMKRITSANVPNIFALNYIEAQVRDLFVIPSYFLTPGVIEKRKPLTASAQRAGWVGCNIVISGLPNFSKIYIVKDGKWLDKSMVLETFRLTRCMEDDNIESRGWLTDVLLCIDRIPSDDFTLKQVYAFEAELKAKHPDNNFVTDKIRQQLQYLRDKGLLEFTSRGCYRKIAPHA